MSQHVTGFPWKYLKIFQFGIALGLPCHSFTFKTLSCHGLGMACHGLSREVTGFHVTSKGKGAVANLQTQLYLLILIVTIYFYF